ncbi:class I SAM-dependent methyltransferase [Kribbella yunnanensis]|uniref:Class I SAM-dependent methyltransferase n=1 Tax=Kribbella yunnanensis TaxID=190194 RepID=A0ABN2GMB9_9ACTN
MNDIQASYNAAATDYHERLKDFVAKGVAERMMLSYFAETVQPGPIGDLGCGTGRITAHLAAAGLDVFGIDLTPGMIAVAREAYPDLRFEVGSIFDLDLKDDELAGALLWYSLVHTTRDELPTAFAEVYRVLQPGGHLVYGYKAAPGAGSGAGADRLTTGSGSGAASYHLASAYGHPVDLDVYLQEPADVATLLADAGFEEVATLTHAPEWGEKQPQAYALVRKPVRP